MSDQIKDKVAIVTGGSKGYGAGIAKALTAAGAKVWITARNEDELQTKADELGCSWIKADVTQPADWDALMDDVQRQAGRLDILVNNAGAGINIGPMTDQTDDAIATAINVNLTGQLYGCRRAAKIMTAQNDGLIINISSGCAIHAWPGWGPYSAAKAGINQFSHCLYAELRPHNVRVTTITPYWGATDFVAAAEIEGHPAADPDIRAKCMQPEDMGQLVLDICKTPAHMVVPDVTVQPLVQQIEPM